MIRKIRELRSQKRILRIILFAALVPLMVSTAYAWTVSAPYANVPHATFGADHGYHRGQVDWYGSTRYIRAGDDYVKWDSYSPGGSSGHLAMVYHAFQPNTNNCGDIRVGSISWSWSNLPQVSYSTKGCGWGTDNEWRANVGGTISTGTNYYFQHLFNDTNNNGGSGEITTNTYWVNWSGSGPYHGKFCINSSGVYAASPGC